MTRSPNVFPRKRLLPGLGVLVLVAGLGWSGGTPLLAQAASSPSGAQPMNGLDFSGLSPQQTATATQILSEIRCNCGCGMTLAECRTKDPNCSRSLSLARGLIEDLKGGKDASTARNNLQAALAKAATPPPTPPPAMDPNKVFKIDVTGAPFKGPKGAAVTLVEFSDYQ